MTRFKVITLSLAVFILVAAGILFVATNTTEAALGNVGVPVRCYNIGSIGPGGQAFLYCIASDGTPFVSNQRVPDGYYLEITDVLITPIGGSTLTGVTAVDVFDGYDTNSRQSQVPFRSVDTGSYGKEFQTPYLVLRPDHRLDITNASLSAFSIDIRISGLLTRNLTYVPLVQRDDSSY